MPVPTTKPAPGPDWSIPPSGWGALRDYDNWPDPWVPKDKMIAHYGGGANTAGSVTGVYVEQIADEKAVLRGWERYHIGRYDPTTGKLIWGKGWRGIAYGWAVGQSGQVYRLRGWNISGAHYSVTDDLEHDGIDENHEGVAVVFILGGDQTPTAAAYAAFERLRAWLEATMTVGLPLWGHKEIAAAGGHSTLCPGPILMAYIDSHRNSGGAGGGAVPIEPPRLLRVGETHDWVPALRGLLYGLGYGGADRLAWPTYGQDLLPAVLAFQRAASLDDDGIVGPLTRAALAIATTDTLT